MDVARIAGTVVVVDAVLLDRQKVTTSAALDLEVGGITLRVVRRVAWPARPSLDCRVQHGERGGRALTPQLIGWQT